MADALLSPTQAARLLRVRRSVAVAWLEAQGLVHEVCGHRRVIWDEVLQVIRGGAPGPSAAPPPPPKRRATKAPRMRL